MYNNPTLEYRLLCALRSIANQNRIFNVSPDLFTDEREAIFKAYRKALQNYGNTGIDAVEACYGRSVPDEIYVPVDVDIDPIVESLTRIKRKRDAKAIAERLDTESKQHDPDFSQVSMLVQKQLETRQDIDGSLLSGTQSFLSDFGSKIRGDYVFLSSGLRFLDSMMGGEWVRSEVTIITGKTGGGKSALMGSSALEMALSGTPVCIVSLEMKKSELIGRWISALTGIDNAHIRSGRVSLTRALSDEQIDQINNAVDKLNSLPLYVIDVNTMTLSEMLVLIQQYHMEYGVNCFFVDYLQLMPYDDMNKHYGLSDALIKLCAVAKKYNLAIIVLAQKHDDGKIRDCGDADKHTAVWIDITIDNDDTETGIRSAILEFFKNRHGRLGKHPALYSGKLLKFVGSIERND